MSGLPSVERWRTLAEGASKRYGIPVNVLLGLVHVESSGEPGQTSSANAKGLTQFIPETARAYGVNTSLGHERSQIFGAAKYLKDLGFDENPALALAKYNAGPGNPGAAGDYPSKVLNAAKLYVGGSVRAGVNKDGGSTAVIGPNIVSGVTGLLGGATEAGASAVTAHAELASQGLQIGKSVAAAAGDIGKVFSLLDDPSTYFRAGKVVGGYLMISAGVVTLLVVSVRLFSKSDFGKAAVGAAETVVPAGKAAKAIKTVKKL